MTFIIDRRSLIVTGALGVAGLAIPGFAQTPNIAAARGFTHAVASGEPAADSMLLWTRYVPADGGAVELRVEIAETPDFARVIHGGVAITGPWRDHTAKITVDGLKPGTRYHYRFIAPDGSFSPIGRTRTLPDGPTPSFTAAIFSCANLPQGYFNAYGHAATRDDIDLAVHLGDYFYEYPPDGFAPKDGPVGGRVPQPPSEIFSLADYRLRYASYRADPDLLALHTAMPMIVQWDDHESANDSWEGGAQNHQANEGAWDIRKAASIQSFREWLPVSDEPWKAYDIGTLATLFRTETRLLERTQQPDVAALFTDADPMTALKAFRDGAWMDPGMTMMGSTQESWLNHAMARSVRAGQRWQVVCFGTIMGESRSPEAAADWIRPDAPARSRDYVMRGLMASRAGLPSNFDNWGGYPAARNRFLSGAQASGANLVVISGDSHNAWAFDLQHQGNSAGVEFAGHAVSSPGYESASDADPRVMAAALVAASSELKWCDTSRRGYMALTLTPDRVRNDWVFVDSVKTRGLGASIGHSTTVVRGRNAMTA
jgi:alkaline phosphatase D